jgi:hypothetical protein
MHARAATHLTHTIFWSRRVGPCLVLVYGVACTSLYCAPTPPLARKAEPAMSEEAGCFICGRKYGEGGISV